VSEELSPVPAGRFIIYDDQDGKTRLDVRFDDETVWLTQAQLADLLGVTVPTISHHISQVLSEGELHEKPTIRSFLIVRQEGSRQVSRAVAHYNLDMIISVGYRVKSVVATRFRIWATRTLREYITKGFVLDDERLKEPGGIDYFDELNHRIRAIRASEKRFYQKVRQLFAETSVDYDKSSDLAHTFFATIQNKLLFAVTGQTAAELVLARCDPESVSFGLTAWSRERPEKRDASIAKSYLTAEEISELDTLVEQFLAFADGQVARRLVTSMSEWVEATDRLLSVNRYELLAGPGTTSRESVREQISGKWAVFEEARQANDRQAAIEAEMYDLSELYEAQRGIQIIADD